MFPPTAATNSSANLLNRAVCSGVNARSSGGSAITAGSTPLAPFRYTIRASEGLTSPVGLASLRRLGLGEAGGFTEVPAARVTLLGSTRAGDSFRPAIRNVGGGSWLFVESGVGEDFTRVATSAEEGVGRGGRLEEGASNP